MDKLYNPQELETRWYDYWEQNNFFAPSGKGESFCLMIPPPNVTGSLHMGHGFGSTLMDILIRYHRMQGHNTLWQAGMDHAGIATQMVVERQLLAENKSRYDLGREKFIEKVWQWKNESGGTITKQYRRLGASMDWTRERFTMDEELSYAVREAFIRLHEEGLIYRGLRLVNWDPKLLTAISDLEVISEEEEGKLWHIRYPLVEGEGHIVVATTRPETLLGDVAVAVNPEDERYQDFIGKHVTLPLTGRTIPIIADEYVDKEFGSGCVKITPAHDFNDYAVGQRHKLIPINIFTPDAHINENAPEPYRGLERFVARKKIIADLENRNLIEKIEKHISKIPRGDRSGVVIEPYLTEQWYMRMEELAAPAIEAVKQGDVKFVPENWDKTYFQWLNNIEDWCISRQLWWGHRIPAWHAEDGSIYVGHDEADVRRKHNLDPMIKLKQDEDVLDTWFSSALWPFSTLGWPEQTAELETFYPTDVLITGFDIIFFWVARMIMMGLKFTGKVPFKEVYITGLIRDAEGQKMSKSKGNVLDPLDLIDGIALDDLLKKRVHGLMQPAMAEKIEKNTRKQFPAGISPHGTDATRFTFCSLATYGREIRFDLGRLEGYRNFCNKLWNAARYVFMNTEGHDVSPGETSLADQWILSRLQTTKKNVHAAFANYRFDLIAHEIYDFTWNEFCDWYLELSKPILTSEESTPEQLRGTRHTLLFVLEEVLRLLHPIMPFITEEIWQRVAELTWNKGKTIMLQPYPTVDTTLQNSQAEAEINWIKEFVIIIRNYRNEIKIPANKWETLFYAKASSAEQKRIDSNKNLIKFLAKLTDIKSSHDFPHDAAKTFFKDIELFIPVEVDKKEEAERLNREIIKLNKETERAESKLQNPSFVDKAPSDVVNKEREKLTELKAALNKLQQQLEKISSL